MAPRRFLARPLAVATAAVLCTHAAHASVHGWDWTPTPGGQGSVSEGGTIRSLHATFDQASQRLTFTVNFSDRTTEGFYLVLTGGPSPLGQEGRYAMIYFDAFDAFDQDETTIIKLSSYTYNGGIRHDSWRDASASQAGVQFPDLIKSALDQAWIHGVSASDESLPDGALGRTMMFDIDASSLITHAPQVSGQQPWFGTGFGDLLGIKFVPAGVFEADYAADGRIEWLGTENEGGFQGEFQTIRIPAPGGALMLSAAGAALTLRRGRRTPNGDPRSRS
ncbi:MAG: hypothetical protein IT438_04355 [Phycisphaerales bacterium]|nr:hypothetical protein [Phycisphaerales bacterium]